MKVLALLLFSCCVSFALSGDVAQVADKLAPKYVIGIDTNGAAASSTNAGQSIRMTNSTGHAFECLIPTAPQEVDKHVDTTDKEAMLQQQAKTTEQILNALSARCLYRLEDWWTYELCYEKHVRQFHKEEDVLTTEYLLGEFAGNAADTDMLEASSKDTGGQYVKQIYTNGDACDLTASTRQTEVRYTCGEGAHEVITSIKEPSTCHYVLSVSVPGLCQLPSFRQQAEPISQIICKPAPSPASTEPSNDADAHKQHQQEPPESVKEAAEQDSASSSNETADA